MARYLVEENLGEKLKFDERSSCSVTIIRSVLRNILGNYTLLTKKDIHKIIRRLAKVGRG